MMADENNTVSALADLKDIAGDAPAADAAEVAVSTMPLREQELDAQGRAYATGRRKDATARVWIKPGTGKVTINGQELVYNQQPKNNSYSYDPHALETHIYLGPYSREEKLEIEVSYPMTLADMIKLTNGKKGEFRRIAHAVGQMKVEVARENWWATMPNAALKAEQTPVRISYSLKDAARLLQEYDSAYAEMLQALGEHPNARKEVAQSWVKYLSRD